VTKRTIVVVLATLALALAVAGAASPPAHAVSFVDKQVQAGALLLQKYVDAYGLDHHFVYPAKTVVKKGGGLTAPIWPSNPWTGKIMGPGTNRGTYTYTVAADGMSYKLSVHLSRGNYPLKGGMPKWFRDERNTATLQNGWLLQRYLDAYSASHGGYPAAGDVTAAGFAGYSWPTNPWTGTAMAQSSELGDFAYTGGGSSCTLKVKLTTGWSSALPISALGRLTMAPGD
jgi:hypothetical protein